MQREGEVRKGPPPLQQLPAQVHASPPANPVLARRPSELEEEEDDRMIKQSTAPILLPGTNWRQQYALPGPPPAKDMWNQSLFLPSEFSNPPERSAPPDEDDDFVASLDPIKVEPESGVKLISPRLPISPRMGASGNDTDLEANMGMSTGKKESGRSFKYVLLLLESYFTWHIFARILILIIGAIFFAIAILLNNGHISQPSKDATSGVELYRWLAFGAICFWCYPVARLVVVILENMLWYAQPTWTTSVYYYLKCCRVHVSLVLVATGWLVAWSLLIADVAPDSNKGYFYGSQVYWLLFISSALGFVARLAKELSASYFERTTFWSLVSDNLKREYFVWACCPGAPVPASVVLTYFRAGDEATRSDPRVLRQCTKYLRRHCITAYSNIHPGNLVNPLANMNAAIELEEIQDVQDLAEIIYDHVLNVVYGRGPPPNTNDDDFVRHKLKTMKASRGEEPEAAVRTMFAVGQNILARSGSSATVGPKRTASAGGLLSATDRLVHSRKTNVEPKSNASRIFQVPNRKINRKDFENRMFQGKDQQVLDVTQVWDTLFDPNKRGHTSRKYFRNNLLRMFNERLGLGHTLKDSQAAVDRLGSVYYGVAFAGILVSAALLFAGPSSYNVWIGITSFFVTLAVVFGNSLKVMAENIVFIFFRHQYDVGDILSINGAFFSVRKLELLSTTLIIENAKMAQMEIFNLSRSGLYWELLEAYVDVSTCTETFLENIRQDMGDFIRRNPESYSGKYQIVARSMSRPLQIKVCAFVEFAYRPVNLTKVFQDIGLINEAFASSLRKFSATEAGVGVGAVRASNALDDAQPVNFLVSASGLFSRTKVISEAMGL